MTFVEILDVTKKFRKETTEVVALRETSLTIDGVTAVVDSGLARIQRHDEQTGLDRDRKSVV